MTKLRLSVPGPFAQSTDAFELQYLASRRTVAGTTVGAATLAHVTFTKRINRSFELVGTIRNLFDAQYADPASDEHSTDAIVQNGRTARIGVRWNFLTR